MSCARTQRSVGQLIPTRTERHALAQSRRPMGMTRYSLRSENPGMSQPSRGLVSRIPCQVRGVPAGAGSLRAKRARILFQLGPGFSSVLLLPLRIEPCFGQSVAEWGFLRIVERQPLLLE